MNNQFNNLDIQQAMAGVAAAAPPSRASFVIILKNSADASEFSTTQNYQLPISSSIAFDMNNPPKTTTATNPACLVPRINLMGTINSLMRSVDRPRTLPSPPYPTMASHPTRTKAYIICRGSRITPISFSLLSSPPRADSRNLPSHLSRSMPSPHPVKWVDLGVRVESHLITVNIDLPRSLLSLLSIVSPPCQLVAHTLPSKLLLSRRPRGV
jgi:hypothetical protein